MRVLITGGTGILGKALAETRPPDCSILSVHQRPPRVVNPATEELLVDVRDRDAIAGLFKSRSFDVVIHAAGISNVDYAEQHQDEATVSNVTGTANVVDLCNDFGRHVIYISTNAVFDGTRAPYREMDPTCPVNAYGRIKAQCEELVRKKARSFSIVRPILMYGWHYPSARKNPVTWLLEKLRAGESVPMVTDVYENPLFSLQAGVALWKVVARRDVDLVHLAGGTIVNRYELAHAVARQFGLDAGLVKAVDSSFFPSLAPRPQNTTFVTERMDKDLGMVPLSLADGLRKMAEASQAAGNT
jgi:dTDP-4-dehydrorhamnose reductase